MDPNNVNMEHQYMMIIFFKSIFLYLNFNSNPFPWADNNLKNKITINN